jgi:2-dehydro-3-deoxyphosphogluconate aldolase/(4S)-4-hydroxy-2-oxoglutarate aldolase
MTRQQVRTCIEETGIIPAIRVHTEADALFAAASVFRGGIPVAEITMTSPGALDLIGRLKDLAPNVVVGAGTVMDADIARACVKAGASFITSPGFDREIVELSDAAGVVCIPGALTPTELTVASRTPAEFIKIFPCSQVGGPAYIRALKRPFPLTPLIASGGVTQKNAGEFIRAGAAALGIGEDLIPHDAVRQRNESWIHELSRRFLAMVREARTARSHAEMHANHQLDPEWERR